MPNPPEEPDAHTKLQRWTDLIAALLARSFPITFDELAREVPAYAEGIDPAQRDRVKKTFERDKEELRYFGIVIEMEAVEEGESSGYRYRLNRRYFYMPYLRLLGESRRIEKPDGYRALPEVGFEPDEIELILHALARLDPLGDPVLQDDARAASAKMCFDLPLLPLSPDVTILGSDRVAPVLFKVLTQALRRRKSVTFHYRTPASEVPASRRVHPYGLFFVHSHWYLAAFDEDRAAVRNFRVSRMSALKVNRNQPQTADFLIPPDFRLQQHAQSRAAWDLGDGEPMTADVEFRDASGAARAAATGGDAVETRDNVRRFTVRRLDTFARWLLSFGGAAVPESPSALVDSWQQLARETMQVYDRH